MLPPAAERLERAIGAAVQAIFAAPNPRSEERKVHGLGVSPGVYEGTARVIRGTEEFGRIKRGDVLVTNSTTTAFNIVLPLLGAIVTTAGSASGMAATASEMAVSIILTGSSPRRSPMTYSNTQMPSTMNDNFFPKSASRC